MAWLVVIGLTFYLVSIIAIEQFSDAGQVGGDAKKSDLMQVEIQAKVAVGQDNLDTILTAPAGGMPPTPLRPELDAGCYEQRLVFAALKLELEGPESAQEYLSNLDERVAQLQLEEIEDGVPNDERFELTEDQQSMRWTMGKLLDGYVKGDFETSDVPTESTDLLKERLGFAAEVFLLPEGTPNKAERDELVGGAAVRIFVMGLLVFAGLAAVLAGFALLIGFPVAIRMGKLKSLFSRSPTNHNLYIQTFAIWIVFFFGALNLVGLLSLTGSLSQEAIVVVQPIVFFSSLLCLLYPVIRGVPFRQVRLDVGLTLDRPLGDVLFSGVAYLATIPCLIPGFIFVVVYSMIISLFQESHEFAHQTGPGHPIQEQIANGDYKALALVLLTACVAAPIVEETMFRGVLYRHLRDWSYKHARWISIIFSAALNGFIFASIHPQGIALIPLLMSLAICFSLVREWRNSLLSPMLMHAIHNTLVTCVLLLVL